MDLVGPTLHTDHHQSGIDDTVPHGWNYYWKATNLTDLSDEVIDVVAEHAVKPRGCGPCPRRRARALRQIPTFSEFHVRGGRTRARRLRWLRGFRTGPGARCVTFSARGNLT
ncbi:MAG: hypothetical protein ACRDO2_07115 [Nocardioidaceae bacterium]